MATRANLIHITSQRCECDNETENMSFYYLLYSEFVFLLVKISVQKSNNFHFNLRPPSFTPHDIFFNFSFLIWTVFTLCTFSIFDKKKNCCRFFSLSLLETRDSRTRCSTKYSLCLGRELFPACNGHFQSCKSVFFVYFFVVAFLYIFLIHLDRKKLSSSLNQKEKMMDFYTLATFMLIFTWFVCFRVSSMTIWMRKETKQNS